VSVRPGDVLELDVERGVYRGQGLARHEGRVVFVPRALPGDRVRARVEQVTPGFVRARLEGVLRSAEGRRDAPCPAAERCGGCTYQPYAYPRQLALKEAVLRDALARGGVPWDGPIATHGSPEAGWRTRAAFHLHSGPDGTLRLGLHEEGSHRVVDPDVCLQVSPAMDGARRALRDALTAQPRWARHVRDVDLAESPDGTRLVAVLETDLPPAEATALAPLADAAPALTGFGVAAGEEKRRTFLGLAGDPHLEAVVAGFRLRSHVRAFFQGNRFLVDPLVEAVRRHVPEGGTVLDLYAGVGLFAVPLGARADRVRGVELSPFAVEDAAVNAGRAGFAHVRVERGDVSRALGGWSPSPDERVVLDPPRTGAGKAVVAAVAARKPSTIVYVSCDPPTLARDLRGFAEAGYAPRGYEMFDLFPNTFHLETVVTLSR
jgi:23S rRNA (uracil1939-C5)-methyltransferase